MQDDLAQSHTIIYHNEKCRRCDVRADVYHGAELLCAPCYFEEIKNESGKERMERTGAAFIAI